MGTIHAEINAQAAAPRHSSGNSGIADDVIISGGENPFNSAGGNEDVFTSFSQEFTSHDDGDHNVRVNPLHGLSTVNDGEGDFEQAMRPSEVYDIRYDGDGPGGGGSGHETHRLWLDLWSQLYWLAWNGVYILSLYDGTSMQFLNEEWHNR